VREFSIIEQIKGLKEREMAELCRFLQIKDIGFPPHFARAVIFALCLGFVSVEPARAEIASTNYVNEAVASILAALQNYVPKTEKGSAGGVASLDSTGVVPVSQLPASLASTTYVNSAVNTIVAELANFVPLAQKGAVNGVASLDSAGRVPVAQIPRGIANGVASLDSDTRLPVAQLPTGYGKAVANGLATLDANGVLTANQLPTITGFIPTTQKAAASGVASLDSTTKVPIAQLPTGATATTIALGNDARFESISTTQPAGSAPAGRVFIWFQ
jgi:hypothetical protein